MLFLDTQPGSLAMRTQLPPPTAHITGIHLQRPRPFVHRAAGNGRQTPSVEKSLDAAGKSACATTDFTKTRLGAKENVETRALMSIFLRPSGAWSLVHTEPAVSPGGSTAGYCPTPPAGAETH